MKVVCDNCRAVYRVPDEKLVKAVNKATCRNCGHRMLIPRPKPNADPEERTLVTAVPPTPVGAPPRAAAMDDEAPETLPGRPPQAPMQRRPPRPSHERTPPVDDTQIPPPDAFDDQPETVVRGVPPDAQPTERPEPAPLQRRTPGPAGRRAPPPRRATPPPAAQRRGTPPPVSQRSTPAPMSPRGTPLPAPNAAWAHDPAADLNWALLGTACALFGAFLLALLSVFNHPLVMWFGLAMAFGGGVLSFMVLLTSGRGRRPARTLLSVVLGFGVAVIMASSMVGTKWGAERVIDAYDINFANTNLASVSPSNGGIDPKPQPTLASVAPVDDGTKVVGEGEGAEGEGAEGEGAEGEGAEGEGEGTSETSTTPSPKPSQPRPTRPSPSPSTSPSPSPAPAAPAPAPAAPAPAAASGGGMETVPTQVVHVMLSNNIDIKRCFVPLFKAGALPPRVDVKFQIAPSGSAASVGVVQSQYKGTELERCLASAVGGIQFPPTNGPGTSITYPFVLQQ